MDHAEAQAFAQQWARDWNAHDVEAVLEHFHEDVVFTSPVAAKLLPETHGVIRDLRKRLDEHYPGKMLLAEANQWPADVRAYFGEGDEFHLCHHARSFHATAAGSAPPPEASTGFG